jgi:hypothetical protein
MQGVEVSVQYYSTVHVRRVHVRRVARRTLDVRPVLQLSPLCLPLTRFAPLLA